MTQRKEKTGICKSVVIATVAAIRDVVKNGFHCIGMGDLRFLREFCFFFFFFTFQGGKYCIFLRQ